MSPEQTQGQQLTAASDVFSLGVVLTELASGRHPFVQDTAALTSRAIQTSEPAWLTANECNIAEPLGSLLRSMLAKEPERRPSAAIVAAQLAAIAHGPRRLLARGSQVGLDRPRPAAETKSSTLAVPGRMLASMMAALIGIGV